MGHLDRELLLKKIADAEIAVYPSFSENFALAPIEAMAAEVATIFTELTSGPELIENGVDGILVNPKNPKEIADAIIYLLQNEKERERIAKSGQEKIKQHFSIGKITKENLEFYQEVIDKYARR